MGLYDRDYGRDDQNPYHSAQTPWDRVQKPRSMTVTLIVINVAVFLVSMLFADNGSGDGQSFNILQFFGFVPDTLFKPWMWWQFLTYGFFHDLGSIWHIVFNMVIRAPPPAPTTVAVGLKTPLKIKANALITLS